MNLKIDPCSHNITQLTRQKGIKSLWQSSEQLLSCQCSLIVAIPAVHSACRYLKVSHRIHSYRGNCCTVWMWYILLNELLLQQSSKPIKYVIRKSMYLQSIGIYHSGMTAYGRKIKTGFAFFNEVFHQPSLAVKFDEILWWGIHVCDNKCVHVNHLVFRLFNLAYHTPFIRPWTCSIHEFAIGYCIIDFIIFGDLIKLIHKIGCFFAENAILLQPDHIACAVFLTLLIKIRCSETAVTTKQNTDLRSFHHNRQVDGIHCFDNES